MNLLEQVGVIVSVALLGYLFFSKLRLPAPAIMGPMICIGILQIAGLGLHELPLTLISVFQIIIGLSVGSKINHNKIQDIKNIWKPSLIIAVYTLISTTVMTIIIRHYTADTATALFSAAPGGITEMTVLALSYNSEVAIVSTFQFVRLIVIVSIIPLTAKLFQKKEIQKPEQTTLVRLQKEQYLLRRIGVYTVGIIGGLFLLGIGFPGGGVVGSTIALGLMNIIFEEEYTFAPSVMKFALLGVGVTIGLEFSPLMIQKIQEMFLPILGFSLLVVFGNILVGWFIGFLTKWDTLTCILGAAPGGLSQMLVVGEEMKADVFNIGIMQLVRILTIILCIPVIAALIT